MGSVIVEEAYQAALKKDWEGMIKFYEQHDHLVLFPVTVSADTALHLAVYSKTERPLQELLEIAMRYPKWLVIEESRIFMMNAFGNTPIHEAAITGNFKAIQLLARDYPELLEVKNSFGETALFKAASFGETKIVKFLGGLDQRQTNGNELSEIHCRRNDSTTILQVAVQGEHCKTALILLQLDKTLMGLKDKQGRTALHVLANMPRAFRSGYNVGIFEELLYSCLYCPAVPVGQSEAPSVVPSRKTEDLEGGMKWDENSEFSYSQSICQGWPMLNKIRKEKRKHKLALGLAKFLTQKEFSWDRALTNVDSTSVVIETNFVMKEGQEDKVETDKGQEKSYDGPPQTPLFIAARRGIIEIVEEILEQHPQAVEHVDDNGQNILHVAIKYRRDKIFNLVKGMELSLARLNRRIDNRGYTLLHQVADTEGYTGGTKPGPALQLQEELQWFSCVEKVIPPYYAMHIDNQTGMTAAELFKDKHEGLLKQAQDWIKETSQSCSTVAVLVATVVFAAAYTVPGGSNEKGIPIFLHSPYFLFFTIMDVVSLASSLTSVVMFLSILTSPFELQEFRNSLPRKLTVGFTLLFFSVVTTMLAFGATILLTVRSEKKWTTSLISIAAFLPVSVFALMQFRLYVAFMGSMKDFIMSVWETLPSCSCMCN